MEELRNEISSILKDALINEEFPPYVPEAPVKKSAQAVRFNPGLENEYVVTFSERGFLIGNTRMSFEEIKTAISKEYTITLKGGTVLDAVKMQQILKYEDKY
jgi:hypothetical protein